MAKNKQNPAQAAQLTLQQALAFHQQGQWQAADTLYQQTRQLSPRHPDALHYHGVLCLQTQRLDQGITLIQQSLSVDPTQPSPYLNLGNALVMAGRLTEALATYDKAIQLLPGYADAHSNRAKVLLDLGRPEPALASVDQALRLNAQMHEAHAIKGDVLKHLYRWEDALAAYDRALGLAPGHTDAHLQRGLVLASLNRHADAEAAFRTVIAHQPEHVEAHSNLGVILQEAGHLAAAIPCFERALALNARHAPAHLNLGVAYQQMGDLSKARICFEAALSLDPGTVQARSNLLFTLSHDPDCSPSTYVQEARRYGEQVSALARPFDQWHQSAGQALTGPLKVGLLSGDLNAHPVGLFLQNVLPHLDPQRVQVFAYATQQRQDEVTATLRPHLAGWCNIDGQSDEAAAQRIHQDQMHILLDLSGHTAHNRLPLMAWRTAPLQATWLGYLASTGVPAVDAILADPVSAPLAHQAFFTEKIHHLPDTGNCFSPPADDDRLAVRPTPALAKGHLTLGCYQNLAKISDPMLAVWQAVMTALPSARLRIQNRQMAQETSRQGLTERLRAVGIDPARVDMVPGADDRIDHLGTHAHVDMMLDTFPYPGITTTCEALWMGVPTVTLAGDSMLSRQGASLLGCVSLSDWVATSTDGYVDTVIQHAADVQALNSLRLSLRNRVRHTSLFDGRLFARQLQDALWALWQGQASRAQ